MPAERTKDSMAAPNLARAAASLAERPLSGIFGINKPSGPTAMSLLDDLKPLLASSIFAAEPEPSKGKRRKFRGPKGAQNAPKVGQGGTLDPLADGVLVIGIGKATKHLQQFLDCTKEYRTTGLLGSATASYDNQDAVVERAPFQHVTRESLQALLPKFTGEIKQMPPVYSAIRMDGKRLFEYAREGIPLPRPIKGRDVRIDELRITDFLPGGKHSYKMPEQEATEDEKKVYAAVSKMAGRPEAAEYKPEEGEPPAFTLELTVSSGTYVRSVVHDLGLAAGSAAHVQRLTRTRQGEWSIDSNDNLHSPDAAKPEAVKGNCIQWTVFEKAIADMKKAQHDNAFKPPRDEEGLLEWEREILRVIVPVSK